MKKSFLAKSISCMLAAILLLSFTACQSGSPVSSSSAASVSSSAPASTSEAAPSTEAKNIEMRMMWWGPDARNEATLKAVELYKSLNPNISIVTEYTSFDGFWTKMAVLAASDTMPDFLQMDVQYIDNYVKTNKLADMSDIDLTGIIDPQIIDNITIDGKLYGLPVGANGGAVVYNKTDLEAAGVALPQSGWNWDDYYNFIADASPKLGDGVYASTDLSITWELYQFYQSSNGGGRVIDGAKLNLNKDLWMEFMSRNEALRKEGKLPKPEESLAFLPNDPQADPMVTGKTMMQPTTVSTVGALLSMMPDKELGVVNMPMGKAGSGWAQSTVFYSASANTPYLQEVKDLALWLISDVEAGKILMTVRGIPLCPAVYDSVMPNLKPADLLGKSLLDVAMANNPLPFLPPNALFNDFCLQPNGIYGSTVQEYLFGYTTLENTYDALIKEGEKITSSAK